MSNDPEAKFDWLELFGYGLGGAAIGAIGGALPDKIESPIKNPQHRKTFHSVGTGLGACAGIVKINQSDLSDPIKDAATIFGVGYLSHLALDGTTPRGLPII